MVSKIGNQWKFPGREWEVHGYFFPVDNFFFNLKNLRCFPKNCQISSEGNSRVQEEIQNAKIERMLQEARFDSLPCKVFSLSKNNSFLPPFEFCLFCPLVIKRNFTLAIFQLKFFVEMKCRSKGRWVVMKVFFGVQPFECLYLLFIWEWIWYRWRRGMLKENFIGKMLDSLFGLFEKFWKSIVKRNYQGISSISEAGFKLLSIPGVGFKLLSIPGAGLSWYVGRWKLQKPVLF